MLKINFKIETQNKKLFEKIVHKRNFSKVIVNNRIITPKIILLAGSIFEIGKIYSKNFFKLCKNIFKNLFFHFLVNDENLLSIPAIKSSINFFCYHLLQIYIIFVNYFFNTFSLTLDYIIFIRSYVEFLIIAGILVHILLLYVE